MKTLVLAAVLLLGGAISTLAGGQYIIPDYATAQRNFFCTKLYVNGGKDLYCNAAFAINQRLAVEHVYAADWIADRFWMPEP
jgi:hypothetical protein